jgi:diaminohydroxyphosphoribosylaminopyrimidine deaminase/5-amino-6-(5-phosphoribosylamino)uracil reductase
VFIAKSLAAYLNKPRRLSCSCPEIEIYINKQGFGMSEAEQHSHYMKLALDLAERGRGNVSPNPMVGCVLVKNNEIVGQGYHQQAGGPHAEIIALQQAGAQAQGASAYVTLEPCCHHGKTPPCTDALIQAGVKTVFAACLDPNPLVAGKGLEQLQNAGIETELGLHEKQASALNEIFFHFIRNKTPFVIAKWAMSLDGKTATHAEDSRDISCAQSREFSHQTRQAVDAILIGSKTAILDNPQLTVRHTQQDTIKQGIIKQPLRIILSSSGKLPLDLKLFDLSLAKTLVVASNHATQENIQLLQEKNIEVLVLPSNEHKKISLSALLDALGKRNITSLLVEGGMTVLHDFFNEKCINKIHVYLAPNIISSSPQKQWLNNLTISNSGEDFFITANLNGLADSMPIKSRNAICHIASQTEENNNV